MILVDAAIWPWRGRRWAHLVSDADYPELHRFAQGLGLARVGFQGDHYDVDEVTRLAAIGAGAEPVGARELLRRLRAAGLRRPAGGPPWRWQVVAEWPLELFGAEAVTVVGAVGAVGSPLRWPDEATALLAAGVMELACRWATADLPPTCILRVLRRPGERAAVVVDGAGGPAPPLAELVIELPIERHRERDRERDRERNGERENWPGERAK